MKFLKALKIKEQNSGVSTGTKYLTPTGEIINSFSPVDGKLIGSVITADKNSYEAVIKKAEEAFKEWRQWPAPKRGEIVRQIGEALRVHK